jgi:hypothetical protein
MNEITREFTEAWPAIVAAFLAGCFAGWTRANTWRRRRERERAEMLDRANR